MATVNQKLQNDAIRHAMLLQGLQDNEVKEILGFLNNEVYPDLEREIDRRLRANMSVKRFNEMKQQYSIILKEGYANASDKLKMDLKPIAVSEADFQVASLSRATSVVNLSFKTPSTRTLHALVNQDVRGQTIDKWFSDLSDSTADGITRNLKVGLAQGESIQRMTQRIRGTRAKQFKDGVVGASRRHAETIVRTSVTDITTKAREETFKENEDIVKGVRWLSTLDAKTSDICQALDGTVYKVGEGQRPPAHMQCRSTTVPITKSWKELGINLMEAPPGTRSSLDGQIPATTKYPEWLKGQPKSVQNIALGKGKAEIFRRGKLSNAQIFKARPQSLTLKEMQKLEKQAIAGKKLTPPPKRKQRTTPPARQKPKVPTHGHQEQRDVPQHVEVIKDYSKTGIDLTNREGRNIADSVVNYTAGDYSSIRLYQKSGAGGLLKTGRGQGFVDRVATDSKNLNDYLKNTTQFDPQQTLWRGLQTRDVAGTETIVRKQFVEGSTIKLDKAVTSWTTKERMASDTFAGARNGARTGEIKGSILIRVKNGGIKGSSSVQHISSNFKEAEVVAPGGGRFKVTKVTAEHEKGRWLIDLEEVVD